MGFLGRRAETERVIGPSTSYQEITREVALMVREHIECEPEVTAYMGARACLLVVRARRGPKAAGELAQRLATEFLGETV